MRYYSINLLVIDFKEVEVVISSERIVAAVGLGAGGCFVVRIVVRVGSVGSNAISF